MARENETKIIEEISRKKDITQRELSSKTQMSLGSVNIILKRLIIRGLVKTRNLNTKKVEYMLTPKGFSEKAKKTYDYMFKTVNLVKVVREQIAKIVLEEFNKGQKSFIVLGNDDLADIIELALKGFEYKRVESIENIKDGDNSLILVGTSDLKTNGFRAINIADKMENIYWDVI